MRQHNILVCCVRALYLERYVGLQSGIPLQIERTYTTYVMLPHHHINFTFLTNFKISHFNKEYMSSLKMI